MRITAMWAFAFLACDAFALLASGLLRNFAPITLLLTTAALVPRLARAQRARLRN
jgi:hypothetical protein